MRHACVEPSVHSVRSDPPYDTFVRAESAALSGERCDLHAVLLDYALYTLLVDLDALLPKFSVDPAIAIVLMLFSDASHDLQKLSIRILTIKSFLPIHIRGLRKSYYRENVLQFEFSSEAVDDSRCFL